MRDGDRRPGPRTRGLVRVVAGIGGALFLASGLWAMLDPRSFFEVLARFPPYNRHLFHDLGAFQIGLGATLLLALVGSDALLVALFGVGIGSLAHVVSHAVDIEHGGDPLRDLTGLSILTAALLLAGFARWRSLRT